MRQMEKNNLDVYLMEMEHVKEMLDKGIISDADFIKAEAFLAKRNCIKDKSIYRLNNLINIPKNVINIGERKETKNEQNNDHKTVTKII